MLMKQTDTGHLASHGSAARSQPSRLELRADGRLWLLQGQRALPVQPRRCFPWSAKAAHISLRDEEDREVAYVAALEQLDADSRVALEHALQDAGLLLTVLSVLAIEEDHEMRCFHVQTRQGERRFQTRLETWPRAVPGGGLLIEDVAGDLYFIPDEHRLDEQSRQQLWAYIDS